jgi:hypothetical protein
MNKPCRFFQQGNCRNGNTCKFSHSGNPSPQQGGPSKFNPKTPYPHKGKHHNQQNPRFNSNNRPNQGFNPNNRYPKNNFPNQKSKYPNNQNKRPHNPHPNQMAEMNSQNVTQTFEVVDLKELNFKRKQGGLSNLIISSVVQLGQMLLIIIKNEQFVILFNLENNQFLPNPLYINCDINQKILSVKSGTFGNIEGQFIFVNYIHFNNLSLEHSSRMLITPLACLDAHKTFLILNISTMGEINDFYIDGQVLLTAVYDTNSNQSELKLAMINDIAKNSSDLKQLSSLIENSFNTMPVEGKVTYMTRINTNIVVALSTGKLFILDVSSLSTQLINDINGETILLETANFGNVNSGEITLVTGSGDVKLATLANPLQCRLTNQMNTALFKAKCLLFNQGKG